MSKYQKAIDRLGLSQLQAGRILGVNPRTSRRWALGEQPAPKAVLLVFWLMSKFKLKPEDIPDDP